MKVIRDGLKYDTDKADKVASWGNGYDSGNFNYCYESLYRTKGGRWFLHGEGGARTTYAVHDGDMLTNGERIIPLSDDEALEWLADHDKVKAAEKWFASSLTDA